VPPDARTTDVQHARALAPAYRVERELGAGGAATVYLAEDTRHDRKVAVKVLRADLLGTTGVDRFIREIRVAARLTHPNIVPVLDSGEAAGAPFYVMPFVEGESLRTRLAREGRIPVAEAAALVAEVADALEYAHAAGIVHRDIKPENILLLRGHALVADFGIARALTQAGGDHRTTVGLVLGTPMYMSPEQASGEPVIDGRSDVYSLATVLFEMIGGTPPFTAPTTQGVIARRFTGPAPRLVSVAPDVPPHVDGAVAAALALEPKDRPTGAMAFARALEGRATAADTPTTASGTPAAGQVRAAVTTGTGDAAMPSVAVLPFANLSAEPDNEFLSDGITEEIIGTLSRLRTIRVAARASSFAFRTRRDDIRAIAGRLGVGHVLDGSVRRAGPRVRVAAELVDAATGFQVWSDRFDRNVSDVFAIQDEIARAIADALSAALLAGGAPAMHDAGGPAYELYLRGRHALNRRTERDLAAAARFFADAVAQQPDLAVAHAALADAELLLAVYGAEPPTAAMPRARGAAEWALTINPALGEALATLGSVRALHDWDWAGADDAFRRATALSPLYPTAWQWRAMNLYVPTGRADEARAAIDRARALDPLSMVMATSVGVVRHLTGDLAGAIRALRQAQDLDPEFVMTHYFLGGALRDAGDLDAAAAAFHFAIAKSGGTPEMHAGLAQTLALQGNARAARDALARLAGASASRHVPACLLAQVHAALGEPDAAEAQLARAAEARDADLAFIAARPAYAPLHGRPAYEALRRRLGV
jgi:serine/threonine-protein kinase